MQTARSLEVVSRGENNVDNDLAGGEGVKLELEARAVLGDRDGAAGAGKGAHAVTRSTEIGDRAPFCVAAVDGARVVRRFEGDIAVASMKPRAGASGMSRTMVSKSAMRTISMTSGCRALMRGWS